MRSIKKTALICAAAIAVAALLFGTALTVGQAQSAKTRYIESETEMARRALCAAADEMLTALREGNEARLNRAAGKAEAYLSRAGLGDCGEIYREIGRICAKEYGYDECAKLVDSIKKAVNGDGNAFSEITDSESASEYTEQVTTEDMLSSRTLKRLGRDRDGVALRRAQEFACPNAEIDECECGIPLSFAYSGENVFVLVSGETPRVVLYCFDRDVDPRYSVSAEEMERTVEMIIKKEKLRLGEKSKTEKDGGVYRTVFYGNGDLEDVPLVTLEIYSDTGRLRLFDAVNYYKSPT